MTDVSFLNEEDDIPTSSSLSSGTVAWYTEKMRQGNAMYELSDFPDNIGNLSVQGIFKQVYFPIKDPGQHTSIMLAEEGQSNFASCLVDICEKHGCKSFVVTVYPDNFFCL